MKKAQLFVVLWSLFGVNLAKANTASNAILGGSKESDLYHKNNVNKYAPEVMDNEWFVKDCDKFYDPKLSQYVEWDCRDYLVLCQIFLDLSGEYHQMKHAFPECDIVFHCCIEQNEASDL